MINLEFNQPLNGASGTNVTALSANTANGLLSNTWAKYSTAAGNALLDGSGSIYAASTSSTGNGGAQGGAYQYRSGASFASNNIKISASFVSFGAAFAQNSYPVIQVRSSASNLDGYFFGITGPTATAYSFGKYQASGGVFSSFAIGFNYSGASVSNVLSAPSSGTMASGLTIGLTAYFANVTYNGSNAVLFALYEGYGNGTLVFVGIDTSPDANHLTNNTAIGIESANLGGAETASTGLHIGPITVWDYSNQQPPCIPAPCAPAITVSTASNVDTVTATAPTPGALNVSGATLDYSVDGVNWQNNIQTVSTYNHSGYAFTHITANNSATNYYRVRAFDIVGFYSPASNVVITGSVYSGVQSLTAGSTVYAPSAETISLLGTGGSASGTGTTLTIDGHLL